MANTLQAKKRIRRNERRAAVNKARLSRVRTYLRKVDEAIEAGDQTVATAALRSAESELMRGVQKGIMHKRTASRKVSRLNAQIKALG